MCSKYIGNWQWFDYPVLGSTNDFALNYTPVFPNTHIIFTAQSQLNGRGRRGRQWFSPLGNLYMSQLFFSPLPVNQMVYIISLSLVQAIESFNPKCHLQIKWPNDIIINDCKICGILIEKRPDNAYVAGIGVNLTQAPQDTTSYPAASLQDFDIIISRQEFIHAYITMFEQNITKDFKEIINEFLHRAYRLHQNITVNSAKEKFFGQFIGIDENGFLLLKQEQEIISINTGEILFS